MKQQIVVYGAGNYCKLLLKGNQLKEYHILKIIDSNPAKWGERIEGVQIEPPRVLKDIQYDRIIIAVKSCRSIAEKLVEEFQISQDMIVYYDYDNNQIRSLKESGLNFNPGKENLVERRLFQEQALRTIKEGLLYESYLNGEFKNYSDIIVVGKEEEFQVVKNFFQTSQIPVRIQMEKREFMVSENQKYVLTEGSYKEDLSRLLNEKGCSLEQCLVVPLFDVENTLIF